MILFHEGWPGSGKTYDAVQKVIDNLKRGRKIYSNIEGFDDPKHREALKCMSGLDDLNFNNQLVFLKKDEIYNFWTFVEKQSLVIIDEAHKFYNSRNWQSKGNNDFADWCSTARHDGIDLILITQDVGKVEGQVRSLAEWTYRYKKINFMGSMVNQSYLCFAFPDQDSKQYLSKKAHRYNAKVFECYKSYATKDIKELKIQNHSNIFKHPIFYLIPIMMAVTGYFMANSGFIHGNLFGFGGRAKSAVVSKLLPGGQPERPTKSAARLADPVVKPEQNRDVQLSLEDRYAWVGGSDIYAVLEERKTGRQSMIQDVVSGGVLLLEEARGRYIKVIAISDDKQYVFKPGGRLPVTVAKIVDVVNPVVIQ